VLRLYILAYRWENRKIFLKASFEILHKLVGLGHKIIIDSLRYFTLDIRQVSGMTRKLQLPTIGKKENILLYKFLKQIVLVM